mmetsp:Transcript_28667/g.95261  ORF Transcript_28667/g.95261 Transcript_28667/m.95261 type:complete len:294 (-) Transcript_28667:142-1023(-)
MPCLNSLPQRHRHTPVSSSRISLLEGTARGDTPGATGRAPTLEGAAAAASSPSSGAAPSATSAPSSSRRRLALLPASSAGMGLQYASRRPGGSRSSHGRCFSRQCLRTSSALAFWWPQSGNLHSYRVPCAAAAPPPSSTGGASAASAWSSILSHFGHNQSPSGTSARGGSRHCRWQAASQPSHSSISLPSSSSSRLHTRQCSSCCALSHAGSGGAALSRRHASCNEEHTPYDSCRYAWYLPPTFCPDLRSFGSGFQPSSLSPTSFHMVLRLLSFLAKGAAAGSSPSATALCLI